MKEEDWIGSGRVGQGGEGPKEADARAPYLLHSRLAQTKCSWKQADEQDFFLSFFVCASSFVSSRDGLFRGNF
jgi:hypothetical protein